MSALVCGLTGTTPEEPVLSKSGYIFERRVIEKYLKANADTCPITGDPLTVDDLIPIKVSKAVKPRPVTAASIPGLLSLMQTEWDSLLTETFSLRTHLETVRNQLSHSLYQHDAACRVIARLLKERDALRQQLGQLQDGMASLSDGARVRGPAETTDEAGLSSDVLDSMKTLAKSLLTQRRKRSLDGLYPVEKVKTYHETASYSIHSTTVPGVTTCCVAPSREVDTSHRRFWSGGADGVIALFDLDAQKTIARLVGHLKRVNHIIPHPSQNIVMSCSDDKAVRIWTSGDDEEYKTSYILRKHTKAVTSLSLHPSGDYMVTSSKDGTWGLHEVDSGQTCRMYRNLPCQYRQVLFHPDGMLLGASGSDAKVYIYDLKGPEEPMVALGGHQGPVTSLAFSENGYYLVTSSDDGTVKVWDLRKSLNFETVETLSSKNVPFIPDKVSLDYSGSYIVACGHTRSDDPSAREGSAAVYYFETKTKLQTACHLEGHTEKVTDASFGPNASYLLTSSFDRTVRVWEP